MTHHGRPSASLHLVGLATAALLPCLALADDDAGRAGREPAPPVVTADKDGFSLKSGDGRFRLKLGAYTHFDYRDFSGDERLAPDLSSRMARIKLP